VSSGLRQHDLRPKHEPIRRPIAVTSNTTASFAYGADGERILKASPAGTSHYLGADAEIRITAGVTGEVLTSYLHPDVKREGTVLSFLHWDSR
jgi:hypothetical protein